MARRADRHEGQILTEDLPASNTDAVSGRDGLGVDDQWFDQVVVLAVSGSVDALTAPQLAVAISAALGSSPAGIIIDLSKVDFLACAGITPSSLRTPTSRRIHDSGSLLMAPPPAARSRCWVWTGSSACTGPSTMR